MRNMGIALASALGLSLSLPAVAGEKVTGVNKDFVVLSETSAAIPDKPGHAFKQVSDRSSTTGCGRQRNHAARAWNGSLRGRRCLLEL
jgi:hypothetical protein